MVTTRGANSFADLQKSKCEEYFTDQFGEENFILTRNTQTTNVSGRPLTNSNTTTTSVVGDLQFNTKLLKEFIDNGIAVLGDGIFYAPSRFDIIPNDKLTNSEGISYRLKSNIMGETTAGQEIVQGWLAIRLPE